MYEYDMKVINKNINEIKIIDLIHKNIGNQGIIYQINLVCKMEVV